MINKAIIITGGNSGIGFECIKQFCIAFIDTEIVAISRNSNKLKQLQYLNLQYKQCDVTDFEQLKSIINELAKTHQIHGLINCAGIAYNGDFCEIDNSKIQQMVDVNIKGLTNTIELTLPVMKIQKIGTIINISSLADRYPRPLTAVYAATKAYVKSLSDSLRVSCAKDNIRICNVSPAIVSTPLLEKIGKNFGDGSVIAVSDFVNIVKFIYSQPQSVCIRDLVVAPTNYEA